MNYIGVDCHISTLEFAVVNERGTITQKAKVNTGVKEFMAFIKDIPKPRKIFIEEGELAGWLLETSLNFVEQFLDSAGNLQGNYVLVKDTGSAPGR